MQWAQRVYGQHYTPPNPQAGRGFDLLFNHRTHIFIYYSINLWHFINRLYTCCQMFDFGILFLFFGLCTLVWMDEYIVWYCVIVLWYSDGTCSGSGGAISPTPVTRPPPGKPYFLEYCINTCAHIGVTKVCTAGGCECIRVKCWHGLGFVCQDFMVL